MAKTNNISGMFNINGCLTQKAIIAFVEGKIDPLIKQNIQNHLDVCPLCADAVEGASLISPENYLRNTQQLRINLHSKYAASDRTIKLRYISYAAVAASVLIITGLIVVSRQVLFPGKDIIAVTATNDEKPEKKFHLADGLKPESEAAKTVTSKKKDIGKSSIIPQDTEMSYTTTADIALSDPEQDIPSNYSEGPSTEENEGIAASGLPALQQTEQTKKEEISAEHAPLMNNRYKSARYAKKFGTKAEQDNRVSSDNELIFTATSQMPSFLGGGTEKFIQLIQDSLKINKSVLQSGFQGDILASFVVDTTGKLKDIKILNISEQKLEQEIINVFYKSPEWSPGKQNGMKVMVGYTVSVSVNP